MAEHKLLPDSMWPPSDGIICIVSGKSPRGDWDHACVAKTQYDTAEPIKIIHDPWPNDSDTAAVFNGGATIITYLIPMKQFKIK